MTDNQEGFEVVDKRRVSADAPEEAAEARGGAWEQEQTAEGAGAQAGGQESGQERPASVDVYTLLASMVGMLNGLAWERMGFVANPATGKIETDLDQARVAIDTVEFLVGKLEARMPASEVRELRRMVTDLQVNFVRRSSSGA